MIFHAFRTAEVPGHLNLGFGADDVNSHDLVFPGSLGGGYNGKI